MEENELVKSFCNSIKDPLLDTLEIGVDLLIENDVLKTLPVVKYVATAYNVFDDIKGKYNLNKLAMFLKELHNNNLSYEDVEKYKVSLKDEKYFNSQLEYSLMLLDRYLDFDKVKILSNLFVSHIDGKITWIEYKKYGEILDRLLPTDFQEFIEKYNNYVYEEYNDSILRLVSLGLLVETTNNSPYVSDSFGRVAITPISLKRVNNTQKIYELTAFGNRFIGILLEVL